LLFVIKSLLRRYLTCHKVLITKAPTKSLGHLDAISVRNVSKIRHILIS
jgi:hypothetical protein